MTGITADKMWDLWYSIQKDRPLVHCITNIVTVNDCANILLAAGASPTMAHHPLEVAEVTAGCKSLVCNMGATESIEAMMTAGLCSKEMAHPIILDPVGVAGSVYRRERALEFIAKINPSCIRGNYSEIKALALNENTAGGVDVSEMELLGTSEKESMARLVRILAKEHETIVIASGEIDFVSDGANVYEIHNGSRTMSKITGCGCMLSALLGAFLAVECSVESAVVACVVMGICGEEAEKQTKERNGGTMTFRNYLIDEVSLFERKNIDKNKMVLSQWECVK